MKQVPARGDGVVKLVLKSGKDASLHRYHPWVFSGAIKKIYGAPHEGDVVDVYDNHDNSLGTGHFQPGSIAVRMLTFTKRNIDREFFVERIRAAYDYRRRLGIPGSEKTNLFRLIHGEGDQLPGLIADFYNGIVVLQMHSLGMYRIREMIAEVIVEVTEGLVSAVYDKSSGTLPSVPGLIHQNGWLIGKADSSVLAKENGFKFEVDFVSGQKTGFFIDQRENRLLAASMANGRDVLNLFGYTGGFSVYALRSAKTVHTVDSSASAIEIAERNIGINYPDGVLHEAFTTDAFGYLDSAGDKYDMIILDPPAFAKHNNVISNALQGYKRLNRKAFDAIKPGGILFTFSCSQVVSRENFRKSVFVAAANAGRSVRILHQLSQPPDHPVNIFHPESEYLKGLVLYVE